jgi:hypothetical protein
LQDPPKFTQIGIFGLKICHLATLRWTDKKAAQLTYLDICEIEKRGGRRRKVGNENEGLETFFTALKRKRLLCFFFFFCFGCRSRKQLSVNRCCAYAEPMAGFTLSL